MRQILGKRVLLGEPLESTCGASSAALAGDRAFISGLTAEGENAATQFRQAVTKLERVLSELDMSLADVVRTRVFYLHSQDFSALGEAHGQAFAQVRPAMSLTQMHYLPGAALAMVEAEAIRGAASARQAHAFDMPHADAWGYSGVVQVGNDLWIAGVTAMQSDGNVAAPGDLETQSRAISSKIRTMIKDCGGRTTDIVSTRHYTAVSYVSASTAPHRLSLMHPHHPTSAGITVQGVGPREAGELIEAEAVIGATEQRRNLNTGRLYEEERHYCRSVRMGDVVYISGTTSVQLTEEVAEPFDAYGQSLKTLEWIRWGIENQQMPFSDLVRARAYVVGEENLEPVARAMRETLSSAQPAITVVGVPALGRPSILVEIEATAVQGAAIQ